MLILRAVIRQRIRNWAPFLVTECRFQDTRGCSEILCQQAYCKQKLMLHVPFHHVDQLKGTCDTFSEAYAIFLQSGNVSPSLEDDIRRLTEHQLEQEDNDDEVHVCIVLIIHSNQPVFIFIG